MDQRFYSEEFKEDAVKLFLSSGKTQKQIADELGVSDRTISNWVRKYRSKNVTFSKEGAAPVNDHQEVIRLRKELARIEMERDILKKALGIVSKVLP